MEGKIRYQRELQKTYLIASECRKELTENFCGQIVLRSDIKGLAKCRINLMDGQREIWYEISSFHTLEEIFAVKQMYFEDLKNLFCRITEIIRETEKFLLDGRQFCFEPEYVYMDMESGQIRLLYDFTEQKKESSLRSLAEFVLERTCHEEEKAVDLAYFFYECAGKENFCIKKIEDYLEKIKENKESQDEVKIRKDYRSMENYEEDKKETGSELIAVGNVEDEKTEKKLFSWDSANGKIVETGLSLSVTSLIAGAAFFIARNYFILEAYEKIVWLSLSVLSFASGLTASVYGLFRDRKDREKDQTRMYCERETEGKEEQQTEVLKEQQWERELPDRRDGEQTESDGKTIYVGKSVLNRGCSMVEIKKGKEIEHPVSGYPFLIGKDKERVHLEVKEHSVSRIHARLLQENDDIYIEDLHSTNGTYLNDLPLIPHDRVKLKRGDFVQLGKAEFIFR